ncbi:MAG: hypothetical protein ETSY1_15570 [Candidatus Entotheonella factor]|uniref:Uncharacterized protein n=1 Tax=Entotheonella factor TaxID=1429438 RepID=W4LMW0_ENTF1|nr:MAG: hypothetical protein ETSY1_15570 [Candidatus Entotheonella factor]
MRHTIEYHPAHRQHALSPFGTRFPVEIQRHATNRVLFMSISKSHTWYTPANQAQCKPQFEFHGLCHPSMEALQKQLPSFSTAMQE